MLFGFSYFHNGRREENEHSLSLIKLCTRHFTDIILFASHNSHAKKTSIISVLFLQLNSLREPK
jgi:hypothetical protein